MNADEKIAADYERAVAAGAVRVGERAHEETQTGRG